MDDMTSGTIPASAAMTDESVHVSWDWRGEFCPSRNPAYAFTTKAYLSLGERDGRGHMHSVPTREYNSSELLDAWMYEHSFTQDLEVREDNGPNRRAVERFMEPVFEHLCARRDGKPHRSVHGGTYQTHVETRWNLAEVDETLDVANHLPPHHTFRPERIMAAASIETLSPSTTGQGALWVWGSRDAAEPGWRPDEGANHWDYTLGPDGVSFRALSQQSGKFPSWALPYVNDVIDKAIHKQSSGDSLLTA